MRCDEFWNIYESEYKKYESPGFQVLNYPLGGDTGCFRQSIYQNEEGKWCVNETVERCNHPHHKEFEIEEQAVEYILRICKFHERIHEK